MMQDLVNGLRERLSAPLPGHDEFIVLSGYQRPDLIAARAVVPAPRESAVLILIHAVGRVPHSLLMVRPEYDGVHSGQVAFPGGRMEPGDTDLRMTAQREFQEEVGVDVSDAEILGALTPIHIPPSRTVVTPFVAVLQELGEPNPDPHEVAALVPFPLSELAREDIIQSGERHVHTLGRTISVPYFAIEGHMVWGATALMLAELRALLHDGAGT